MEMEEFLAYRITLLESKLESKVGDLLIMRETISILHDRIMEIEGKVAGLPTVVSHINAHNEALLALQEQIDILHDACSHRDDEYDEPISQMTDADVIWYYDGRIDALEDRIENDKRKVSVLMARRAMLTLST